MYTNIKYHDSWGCAALGVIEFTVWPYGVGSEMRKTLKNNWDFLWLLLLKCIYLFVFFYLFGDILFNFQILKVFLYEFCTIFLVYSHIK